MVRGRPGCADPGRFPSIGRRLVGSPPRYAGVIDAAPHRHHLAILCRSRRRARSGRVCRGPPAPPRPRNGWRSRRRNGRRRRGGIARANGRRPKDRFIKKLMNRSVLSPRHPSKPPASSARTASTSPTPRPSRPGRRGRRGAGRRVHRPFTAERRAARAGNARERFAATGTRRFGKSFPNLRTIQGRNDPAIRPPPSSRPTPATSRTPRPSRPGRGAGRRVQCRPPLNAGPPGGRVERSSWSVPRCRPVQVNVHLNLRYVMPIIGRSAHGDVRMSAPTPGDDSPASGWRRIDTRIVMAPQRDESRCRPLCA